MSDGVPDGWATKRLSDVTTQTKGLTYKSEDYGDENNGLPFLTLKSISKSGGYSPLGLKYYKGDFKPHHLIESGDILFANTDLTRDGDVVGSPLYFYSFEFQTKPLYSMDLSKLVVDPSESVGKFLYYLLMTYRVKRFMINASAGSTVLHLDTKSVKSLPIILPPLPEQRKIAAILTSVDEVIEATQRQIDKLQDLKKATMNELLTKGIGHTEFKDSELGRIPKSWDVKTLGEILDLKNGVNTDKDAFGSGSPFITYMDVHSGNDLDETVLRKFVKLSAKENEAFSVKFGDVFFTRTSETPEEIGLSNTYLGRDVGAVFNGFCIRGRPKNKLLSAKLSKYLFRSEYIRTQMKLLCKYTTRAGISGESLNRCLIALPPMNEQVISENTIISFDKDLRLKEIKLAQTQSLKKSLMQDLLTGKVRVKVD